MKSKHLISIITYLLVISYQLQAQTDVTSQHLTNSGFDTGFNYDANTSGNISGDIINNVSGWNKDMDATYTVAGTFAYGSGATFNGSSAIPNSGYKGSTGGALALSTGWGTSLRYSQTVTLNSGKYALVSAYYNAGTATAGSSLLGWTPDGANDAVVSAINSYPVGTWITDTVEFMVTEDIQGKIQIGFKAMDGSGSGSSAKILIDYVNLIYYGVDKTALNTAIIEAEIVYGNGSGIDANILLTLINAAKAVLANEDASMLEIDNATNALTAGMLEYQLTNASDENPLNMTDHIVNPSFEESFVGWTNNGMAMQGNTNFPLKDAAFYIEKWVNRGAKISDVSIEQQLTDIPNGKYRLTAATGNIQQTGAGSTVNTGNPQTGAFLFGGYKSVSVDTIKERSIDFFVLDNKTTIGLRTENATGNWLTCDNLRLSFLGPYDTEDVVDYVNDQIAEANSLLVHKMQNIAKQQLETVIAQAQQAIILNPQVLDDLIVASEALASAINTAKISVKAYANLQAAISEALDFQENDPMSTTKAQQLQEALAIANIVVANLDADLTTINDMTSTLLNIIRKKLYTATLGNVNDPNSQWSLSRKKESKHWVIFWEAGYGEDPSAHADGNYRINIDGLLKTADDIFEFYADSLKFITRGKSKTDDYKMIIRLRYTRDWEATGSGVNDMIGLLTLTAWSAQAGGHTLAHEIGHCFQYQTHCDNNNQNGWMYGFGENASGGNCWWEQCAQWQGFKIYPAQQFTDGRFAGYMKTVHKHILHETPRYDNYFIQDYWSYLHGMDFIGRMWNESKRPEDPIETYMRITGITQEQFNDEMYDCAAKFTTWDISALRSYGTNYIDSRPQTQMTNTGDDYWQISSSACIENYGHNIIRLNAPTSAERVSVFFEGQTGIEGFRKNYVRQAGWRYGFVALLRDGTRVYSDMGSASYNSPSGNIHFDCPNNCKRLWLVVSGAPTSYWRHAWDDTDLNDEQWPYKVKFNNTNLLGNTNTDIANNIWSNDIEISISENGLLLNKFPQNSLLKIYDMQGHCLHNKKLNGKSYSTKLSSGFYIIKIHSNAENYSHKIVIP